MHRVERLQLRILGVVQGVGFRPFVHRLATQLGLKGWVLNDEHGVLLEVEGTRERLLSLLERLPREKPTPSLIFAMDHRFLAPMGFEDFQIRPSKRAGKGKAWILPDLAICDDCRREVLDPGDRRNDYPFTNCTNCGPRFTIIEGLPYDRPRTSMKAFTMCERCRGEYEDPEDRRFHAQPNACSACGPRLNFVDSEGNALAGAAGALSDAARWVREGRIVGVKGLGGYHLVLDATNQTAVQELRRRKERPYKPFAIMGGDLEMLRRYVEIPGFAEPILQSSQAPILILPRSERGAGEIAPAVAPRSPHLGVFLPTTPLHALLLREIDGPVVATSGNLTDQPTIHRDEEAHRELAHVCDAFLDHDRPIVRQADDSVLHVLSRPAPKPQMLRRARGYTPLPLLAPRPLPSILALGGQMNAVFALARGREVILSQHLGELESHESRESYRRTLDDFLRLYEIEPMLIAHDMHPDYFTTRLAAEFELPTMAVQHHHAHLAACMLENELTGPLLGLCWDGTGFGPDGTIWGGEFLRGGPDAYERVATLHPFRLPGGSAAIAETWRTALALLWESYDGDIPRDLPLFEQVAAAKVELVLQLLRKEIHAPVTTSMGRLFDGMSALLGLSYENTHQAQSPQLLEAAAWAHGAEASPLPLALSGAGPRRLDWRESVRAAVEGLGRGRPAAELAAAFHHALTHAATDVIEDEGRPEVVLAGGVFCNRYLSESMLVRFAERKIEAHVHAQLPPTDGSLAVGQLWVAAQREV